MSGLRKAAEMALDFISRLKFADAEPEPDRVMDALRQALAQPEQEPVAWIRSGDDQLSLIKGENDGYMIWKPLYTAPPSKPWVSLTDEEIKEGAKYSWVDYQAFQSVAWWADEKLKEKNT